MFDRPSGGQRAVLVIVRWPDKPDLSEFEMLAESADIEVVGHLCVYNKKTNPKFGISTGKVELLKQSVIDNCAELVLFDEALTPSQAKNLEYELNCLVLDRTALILDIFAKRAITFEGQLQVELAQLQYLSTRLIRGWTHLERQKGGIGLRGPGETQLETDKRLIRARIESIKLKLSKVRKTRAQNRNRRDDQYLSVICLVGYTNAGKSTLFNKLTAAHTYIADQLFATLDPLTRQWDIPGYGPVLLIDTVGFIQNLPHDLVDAFKATLEETLEADLLLHVVSAADEERLEKIMHTEDVLNDIGAENIPQIIVYNKVDLTKEPVRKIPANPDMPPRLWLSATTGQGVNLLEEQLIEQLNEVRLNIKVELPLSAMRLRARLFDMDAVLSEDGSSESGCRLHLSIVKSQWTRLCNEEGLCPDSILIS